MGEAGDDLTTWLKANPILPPAGGCPGIDYLEDNAVDVIAQFPAMAAPCAHCPAIPGTEANQNWLTKRIYDDCVASHHAFWCHLTAKSGGLLSECSHLCGGWVRALDASRGR